MAGIDRIRLVLAQRVVHPVEPARHERVDDGDGMTGFCPGRRPVQVEHAGRFDEHEQALARRDVALEEFQELAPSGPAHRQVSFHKESLAPPAQREADFMFCGIQAEVVIYFH